MNPRNLTLISFTFALLLPAGCGPKDPSNSGLAEALTFHASFDNGPDADFAKGDGALYTATAVRPELVSRRGLPEEARLIDGGRFGKAIYFNTPEGVSGTRAFYKLPDNFVYQTKDWSGAISFWIKVTPDEDLRPGFTDPIQLTPRSALDGCLWVDFSRENPRDFRMGAFPDKQYWNPDNQANKDIPDHERPLIPVVKPPFSRDHWSHIVMTFEGFNNPGKGGVAKLYVNGKLHNDLTGWEQIYTWDLDKAQIRLGVNFVGALDELSCFNRALSANEVAALYNLDAGVSSILR